MSVEHTPVTIVIPYLDRWELLRECLFNIRSQHHAKLEVIIVVDGPRNIPDLEEVNKILNYRADLQIIPNLIAIKIIPLGEFWSQRMPTSFGIAPLIVGYLTATHPYIMPWCDDERARAPYHLVSLATLLDENPDVDFVYPKVYIWRNGDPHGEETAIIGVHPPVRNQITHYMFRRETLIKYGMPDWEKDPIDWFLVEKWLKNGASSLMLDTTTFEHRLDR